MYKTMYPLTADVGKYTCWWSCKEDPLVKQQHVQMPSEWFGLVELHVWFATLLQYSITYMYDDS